MREIKVTAPRGKGVEVVKVARASGISEVAVYQVFVYGPDEQRDVVSVETSTRKAKRFIDALLSAPFFDPREYTVISDELRAIVAKEGPRQLTHPMTETTPDVFEDLWQRCHITVSLAGRALVAALILAYGMLEDSLLSMIAAMLFTPFLPQVLATSFGLQAREWGLARQGALALAVNTGLTVLGGAATGLVKGGSVQFDQFSPLLVNVVISALVGVAAVLATADDVGRRDLIALAAAAQYAIIPTWLGLSLVLGFPDPATTLTRLATFGLNVVTILAIGAVTYVLLDMRGDDVRRFARETEGRGAREPLATRRP